MIESTPYFDTPQRSERMQLLMHLVANAEDIPYLRAPHGAGKTRFARCLAQSLDEDFTVVWTTADVAVPLREQLSHELDLQPDDSNWLAKVIEGASQRPLLLIVDDADALQLAEIADVLDLAQAGARLLLVGTGGLARARGNWDLQFVDLPPFSEEETRAFIEARGSLPPGKEGERMAAALHRAAEGLPGLLLDALDTLPAELPERGAPESRRRSPWPWVSAAALLLLAVVALWNQDAINSLVAPKAMEQAAAPEVAAASPSARTEDRFSADAPIFKAPETPPVPVPALGTEASPPVPASSEATEDTDARTSGGESRAGQPTEEVVSDSRETPASAVDSEPAEPGSENEADPVLDAIVAEAIRAAAQPQEAAATVSPRPSGMESASVPAGPEKPAARVTSPEPAPRPAAATGPRKASVSSAATPARAEAPGKKPKPVPTPPPKLARPAPAGGLAWLHAQPARYYTLQLVGARDHAAIEQFLRRHRIPGPHAVFQRQIDGKPWYSLVAGSYPDREAAVAARARLPSGLAGTGVWPRTFGSIQAQMQSSPQ